MVTDEPGSGRASEVDEILETAASDYFWVPEGVHVVDREEITYAHSDRPGEHYNNVSRVRPKLGSPEKLVEEVVERHRGCVSLWNITPMSDDPEMLEALRSAEYRPGHETHAYAIDVGDYDREVPDDVEVREVGRVEHLRTLYRIWEDVFGDSPDLSEEDFAAELGDCTGPERRVARFVAYLEGEPAGSAGLTFFDDLSFGLLWAGGVREEHRNRGVYTSLLRTRAEVAAERGIGRMGLYARDRTSAPIVEAHGFERHGPMIHWRRDLR